MIIFVYSPIETLWVDAVWRWRVSITIIPGRTCRCPWLAVMLAPITILKTEVKLKKKKQFNNLTRRGRGCVMKFISDVYVATKNLLKREVKKDESGISV